MVAVGTGLAAHLVALVALLGDLSMAGRLGATAWGVGLASGLLVSVAVGRSLGRAGVGALGPADLVTLTRAMVTCAVAALVADAFLGRPAGPFLVALAVGALLLDAVDGWVARRTRTVSAFGARFDGEVDALLILVLSVYAARSVGIWVLAIGAARYLFGAAGWVWPWMREQLPARYWRKVVAAVQGVVLTVAAAAVVPPTAVSAALVVALALLTESFGRDVVWLCVRRFEESAEVPGAAAAVQLRAS